ncbi:MAG: protoporphyrinogen oxidase [Planctomycetaceae bacterium]
MHDSSKSSRPPRVAVIGGGLSGLVAAFQLGELSRDANVPLDVSLFEAQPRVGGVIETRHVDGYLVEMSSDSFITNTPWAVDLCRRLGLDDQLIATDAQYRRSLVLRKGRPVDVPEGFTLLAPAKVWPLLTSPIFSPWGKLRMGMEYLIPRKRDDGDESLASFVRRRFGSEALDRLVQPLVGGIYTSDPEKLSLKATLPRFVEMERNHRSLIRASRRDIAPQPTDGPRDSGARYSLFASLADGLGELIDALAARIEKTITVKLQTVVERVEREGSDGAQPVGFGGWRLILRDGSVEHFDAIVVALPTHHAARLVAGFAAPLADSLSQIEYASSAVVVTGHRLADVAHPLDAFGMVVPAAEGRDILAVSFASRKFPGRAPADRVLLRTFIGGAMQPELFGKSDEELIDITRRELADIFGVGGREDFALVSRHPHAMPQYNVGHLERVACIERLAAEHRGLALAGNAYHGVGIPDCIRSGQQAAQRIFSEIPASGRRKPAGS